jgi:hypothetical protein
MHLSKLKATLGLALTVLAVAAPAASAAGDPPDPCNIPVLDKPIPGCNT